MKAVSIRQAHNALSACIEEAQDDPIVITSHGRVVAILVGARVLDPEAAALGVDGRVWKFVRARRSGKFVSHEEARQRLGLASRTRE